MPQDAYGWEKLITEQLCYHYNNEFPIDIRTVRFHNIFGPEGLGRAVAKRRRPANVPKNPSRKTTDRDRG